MGQRVKLIAALALIGALYSVPSVATDPYLVHIGVLACLYAIPAVGLNLMLGYTGLVSLGHMGFAGIGAYVGAILLVDAKLNYWVALAGATITAGAVGAMIGTICLRFRTHFFMIVTLAFGLLLYSVFNNWDAVTRGAVGFAGIPRPRPIEFGEWRFTFGPLNHYYYLVLTAAVLVFGIQRLVVRSDFGRTLAAIRQDEKLAQTQGVDVMRYKVAVFGLGAALAGLGGLLHVSFLRVAAPASFNLAESINAVLIVVLGGAGSLIGPALGALVFVALPEYLRMAAEWRLVIFGALLVLITLFAPQGLAGLLGDIFKRRRAKDVP